MARVDESHTNLDGLQLARAGAVELQRGTVLAGRYEIETTLGRGGAGLVLRAHDRELREAVAIKVLRPDLGNASRWIERLAREVKLARQLRHPNVCRVFDFEKADGQVFIVMELATGGTLRRELDEGILQKRPFEARLADARAVAAGLAAIHEAGIAHRDVTPQNVLRMTDGRLIVSDFGLATEVSQTTTSIHGGTLAYMAPEVVRGQRGTFASDVWALGVVIHEIVFGQRPTWSKPLGGMLVPPIEGRTLSRAERVALSVCRACMDEDAARRPKSGGDVGAWLESGRPARAPRRKLQLSLGAVALAGIGSLALWARARTAQPPADASGFVELAERPADWTAASRVVATIDDRLQCMKALPDRNTVRFVWGHPARSEDLDLRTGRRIPSPLVPEASREGCTDLSPDGQHLAFQGYAPDGRAFAFVSDHPDGRAAVPVVAIADPSMSSEPKWLPDGRAFTFDIDHQHMGVFSLDTHRTTVLPDPTTGIYHSSTRFLAGSRVFIAAGVGDPYRSDVLALDWPLLAEAARFSVPGLALDLASRDGNVLYVTTAALQRTANMWKVDLDHHTRAPIGMIPDQTLRYPSLTDVGLAFSSLRFDTDVWRRGPDGLAQVTHTGNIQHVAPCGENLIVVRDTDAGPELVRMSRGGQVLEILSSRMGDIDAVCSPDGHEWYTARWKEPMGAFRCGAGGCERIIASAVQTLSISPDGERIAFTRFRQTEPVVAWMSARGGEVHEVSTSETGCPPGWSSNRRLWISHRPGGHASWSEIDAETLEETGRVVAGEKDCTDGSPDPASPVSTDWELSRQMRTQIRIVPNFALSR